MQQHSFQKQNAHVSAIHMQPTDETPLLKAQLKISDRRQKPAIKA